MFSPILLLLPLLIRSTFAANDWSKPCLSGTCEYDIPATNGTSSGTIKIWGSEAAISDITNAAGWQILGCSPDALAQDIRLVCTDESSGKCAHLYSNSSSGAVGKLVRLPENCGKSAFAVITRTYLPQDQSLPPSLARRDGANTTVQGLSISANFASVGTPSTGAVNFAIRAANVPGAAGDLITSAQQERRGNSRIYGRGAFDFVRSAISAISSLNDFDVNKSTTLPPFDADKKANLVDQSISCPPANGQVKVDVEAKAHAVASIGVAATGTILPPKVSSFAVITGLNAQLDGTMTLTAEASGTLDSGKVPLFQVGIPGLDFPGILSIGPSFKIDGQATASLDASVGMTVGLSYKVNNAQLVFPPSGGEGSKGAFNIGDTPLQISATPNAKASGTVTAHLIPSVNLGISALGDTVSATIFLNLDTSASMTLSAQAEGSASATIGKRSDALSGLTIRGQHHKHGHGRYLFASHGAQMDNTGDNAGAPPVDDGSSTSQDSEDTTANNSDADDGSDSSSAPDTVDTADDESDASSDPDSEDDSDSTSSSSDSTDSDVANTNDEGSVDSTDAGAEDTTDDGSDTSSTHGAATEYDAPDDSTTYAATSSAATTSTVHSSSSATNTDAYSTTASSYSTASTSTAHASSATSTVAYTATSSTAETSTSHPSSSATVAAPSATASSKPPTRVLTSTSGSFGGCFEVVGGFDVNAGASGSFFGLFDKSTQVSLFSKKFEILKKCFGTGAGSKRSLVQRSPFSRILSSRSAPIILTPSKRAFNLQCPSTDANASTALETVLDETIPASSVQ